MAADHHLTTAKKTRTQVRRRKAAQLHKFLESQAMQLFLRALLCRIGAPVHLLSGAAKKKIAGKAKAILLHQKVGFMSLPRELRDFIYYEYAQCYPALKDVVHCCTASFLIGQNCFICNAIPQSAPYVSTVESRAKTNYSMLLVNKQCRKEFLETMDLKDHVRHVFHVSLKRSFVFFHQCANLDLSSLSYRFKIIVDFDSNPFDSWNSDRYQELANHLPKFGASIPNIRNVEIVHANRYCERQIYCRTLLYSSFLKDESGRSLDWQEIHTYSHNTLPGSLTLISLIDFLFFEMFRCRFESMVSQWLH